MVNLDTHVLVLALAGQLSPRERRVLAGNDWSVSAIVVWEPAKLVQLGRLDLDLEAPKVVRILSAFHVWPIDPPVSVQSTRMDFKGEPADELIAATSVAHAVPLLTRDRLTRRSQLVTFA